MPACPPWPWPTVAVAVGLVGTFLPGVVVHRRVAGLLHEGIAQMTRTERPAQW